MKKRSIIIRLLILIVTLLVVIMIGYETISNPEDDAITINRKTGRFSSAKMRAIANSFRTKSWNDKESDQSIEEDLFSFSSSTYKKSDRTVKDDDSTGKILDDALAAITVAGIEEDQTVGSVLASILFISVDEFNIYYIKALSLTTIEEMDLFFPDNTIAIEIYKKAYDIKSAIEIINCSR